MTRKTRAKAILKTCDDLPFGMLGHGYVNLAGDIMCSKKYHIIITCRAIHFGTAKMIKNEKTGDNDEVPTTNYQSIPSQSIES